MHSSTSATALIQWYARTGSSHTYTRRYSAGRLPLPIFELPTIPVALIASLEGDLVKVPSLRIVQVHGAGKARVKGVDRPENLDRLIELGNRCSNQRRFKRRVLLFGVARRAVPSGRNHQLIVLDLAVLDLDPVSKRAARGFDEA